MCNDLRLARRWRWRWSDLQWLLGAGEVLEDLCKSHRVLEQELQLERNGLELGQDAVVGELRRGVVAGQQRLDERQVGEIGHFGADEGRDGAVEALDLRVYAGELLVYGLNLFGIGGFGWQVLDGLEQLVLIETRLGERLDLVEDVEEVHVVGLTAGIATGGDFWWEKKLFFEI
jgi:hypothetical protein